MFVVVCAVSRRPTHVPVSFVRHPGGRVTFCDSGHPALRPSGRLRRSRRSCGAVLVQEKVTKENTPSVPRPARSAGCATGGRGSADRASCPAAECARSLARTRADARALSVRPSPRHRGTQIKSTSFASAAGTAALCSSRVPLGRGEQAQEKPEGARAGCARVRCQYTDVLSANPGA